METAITAVACAIFLSGVMITYGLITLAKVIHDRPL